MKKIFYFAAMMALCLSCTKEQQGGSDVIEGDVDSGEVVAAAEFSAEFSQEGISKTHLGTLSDGAYPNYWSVGDCINVNGSVSAALGSEYSTNSRTARFLFDNAVSQYGGYWYIGYPAGAFTSFNKGTGTVVVPSSQTYTAGTYDPEAFVMVGKANGKSVKFYPKMGIVRITATDAATPYSYKISKVRLEAIGGESLSGTFTTDYNNVSATFTSTSGNSYVDINAPTSAGLDFGSTFFFAVPIGTYAGGLRFTIYTKDDKSMSFSNASSIEVGAGTMKNITSPAYVPSSVTISLVRALTSSSIQVRWDGSNISNNRHKTWKIHAYTNSACTSEFGSGWTIPASEAACWDDSNSYLTFVVGGLSRNTSYWFKVEDVQNGIMSAASSKVTTQSFTQVSMPAAIISTGVVLAEDFNELAWGSTVCFRRSAGFRPSNTSSFSNLSTDGATFYRWDGEFSFRDGALNTALTSSRLNDWMSESYVYAKPGHIKLGISSGTGWVLTPPIPSGSAAVVNVSVDAAKYNDSQVDDYAVAVIPEDKVGTGSGYRQSSFTWPDTSDDLLYQLISFSSSSTWQTSTASGLVVGPGDRIVVGTKQGTSKNSRLFINSISVEATSLIYVIKDVATLQNFMTNKPALAMVTADIDMTGQSFTTIAGYTGTLYGNGHTITGLTKPFFDDLQGTVRYLTLNSTLNISSARNNIGILANTATDATITGCVTMGSVTSSAASVSGDLSLGGLIGSVSGCTLVGCQNQASVTNTTTASDYVWMGGLIGSADGANTLTGTSTTYNSNKALLLENSASTKVAVGGICGYTFGAASDFEYAKNLAPDGDDVDDILIKDNTRDKVYVGCIIGMSANTTSFDYASNTSADICFQDLTMSATGQVFAGGIIGGWTTSGTQTITGCTHSGWIYTKHDNDGAAYYDDIGVSSTATPLWSCFGGVAGMGASSSSEALDGGWNTITGKTFTNCSNSGRILIYCKVRCCIGGVVAYTENAISDCECTGNIRLYKKGGIGTVNKNYHRQVVGGVVGFFSGSSATNLKYDGTILTQSSSPFAYTSGVIGYLYTSAVTLNNCRVGGSIRAAGSDQGRNAVMCHNNTNTVNVTFTDCLIQKGTISYATGSKVTINSNSDVTNGQCMGESDSGYTIVGGVLPTVASSI